MAKQNLITNLADLQKIMSERKVTSKDNKARSRFWNEGRKAFIASLAGLETKSVIQLVKHQWCPTPLLQQVALTSDDPEVVKLALMNQGPDFETGKMRGRYPLRGKAVSGGGYEAWFTTRSGDDVFGVLMEDTELIGFIKNRISAGDENDEDNEE